MISSVKINNFRCFDSVDVDELSRINVVVGRNASGKTTLLEGIFLALGASPELALRLRAWRGLGDTFAIAHDPIALQELWADLFYQFDLSKSVGVQLKGTDRHNRSLRISYHPRRHAAVLPARGSVGMPSGGQRPRRPAGAVGGEGQGVSVEQLRAIPIRFDWSTKGGESLTVYPELGADGIRMPVAGEALRAVYFQSNLAFSAQEVAARYSRLSQRNQEWRVIEALREEFPFVRGLSVEVSAGVPMVQASVDGVARKIPLGLVSGGVSKLLSLLVAIADSQDGIVLVDEIENGFYFDRLPAVWGLLLRFCEQNNTQLFCSTHSYESIASMREALNSEPKAFSLLRVEVKEDRHVIKRFGGENFAAAVEQHVEIR